MIKALQLIELWKDWKPTDRYFAPYTVANYYWIMSNFVKIFKPIFPYGEINDVAAFLAGSKPTAVISSESQDEDPLLEELIEIARKKKKSISIEKNQKRTIYFANNEKDLKKLIEAWNSNDIMNIGLILGYPIESINRCLESSKEGRKILDEATGKENRQDVLHKVASCFRNDWLFHAPEFKISDEWFEKNYDEK